MLYFSELLERDHKKCFQSLKQALGDHHIPFKLLPHTKDIWCRDYMPVKVAENRYVKFNFNPSSYKEHTHELTDSLPVCEAIQLEPVVSGITIDGGNVVWHKDRVIMTEMIFMENPCWERKKLVKELSRLLEAEILLIPAEPDDEIGHADGMVVFLDDSTVLVNDYRGFDDEDFDTLLTNRLKSYGLKPILFPYSPVEKKNNDGIYPAYGVWINFLQVNNLILFPQYNMGERDEKAIEAITGFYPRHTIIPVECRDVAAFGGALHCVSWEGS